MSDTPWVDWARDQIGTNEKKDNAKIVGWLHDLGHKWVKSSKEVAWCDGFRQRALKSAGLPTTKSLLARDGLKQGTVLKRPVPGAYFAKPRGNSTWQGHTGIIESVSKDGKSFTSIDGNVNDSVDRRTYLTASMLGFRWPDGAPMTAEARAAAGGAAPEFDPGDRVLDVGSSGPDVEEVQVWLDRLGYMDNDPEVAVYGSETKMAVMAFQRDYGLKPIDGKVGPVTAPALETAATEKARVTRDTQKVEEGAAAVAKPVAIGAGGLAVTGALTGQAVDVADRASNWPLMYLMIVLFVVGAAAGGYFLYRYGLKQAKKRAGE